MIFYTWQNYFSVYEASCEHNCGKGGAKVFFLDICVIRSNATILEFTFSFHVLFVKTWMTKTVPALTTAFQMEIAALTTITYAFKMAERMVREKYL